MSDRLKQFEAQLLAGYTFKGEQIKLGAALLDGDVVNGTIVSLPMKTMNRHGLVAGATGTGKTKTLQGLAEQLSAAGVPVVVADIKGDLSGLAAPGATDGPAAKRAADLGETFTPAAFPVEF